MLYLKCTNNILKLLDLRKEQLIELQTSEAPLGNWYIQQFSMDSYRLPDVRHLLFNEAVKIKRLSA